MYCSVSDNDDAEEHEHDKKFLGKIFLMFVFFIYTWPATPNNRIGTASS